MEILLNHRPTILKLPSEFEEHISLGLGLVFEPEFSYNGEINLYNCHLLNDTWDDVMIRIKMELQSELILTCYGRIQGMQLIKLIPLSKRILESKPQITIELSHKHFKKPELKTITLNFAQVLKQFVPIRHLKDSNMHFLSFYSQAQLNVNPYNKKSDADEIADHSFEVMEKTKIRKSKSTEHELLERANFTGELDLHFNPKTYKKIPEHILEIQIQKMNEYLDKAISLNWKQIKVIHGKGNGILKKRIYEELKYHPKVKSIVLSLDGGSSIIQFVSRK